METKHTSNFTTAGVVKSIDGKFQGDINVGAKVVIRKKESVVVCAISPDNKFLFVHSTTSSSFKWKVFID